jgi:CRISPR-associated endoribonuclease Cas6
MRLRLDLGITQANQRTLPLNYQYAFSAWIYKVIQEGNHDFAGFLHSKGFATGTKAYKFFTFSMLQFQRGDFQISGDRLLIQGDSARIELSFLVPDAIQHFITGIFRNQHFTIGDQESRAAFVVKTVEAMPLPGFEEEMRFTTLSPMIVSRDVSGSRNAQYLEPTDGDFERIFFDNLVRKCVAATEAGLINCPDYKQQHDLRLEILSEPKKKGITIKPGTIMQTKIIGYMFDFRLTAAPDLIRLGYLAGFGEKNSLGMGCVGI